MIKHWVAIVVVLLSGTLSAVAQNFRNELEKFDSFYYYLNSLYVEELDNKALIGEAISAVLESLDPHSAYVTPEQMEREMEMTEGAFGGIGVQFGIVRDTVRVISTYPDSPARRAGLKVGDRIVAIGDTTAVGIDHERISQLVRGKKGSKVSLRVQDEKSGTERIVTLQRDDIPIATVDAAYTILNIGYVRVNRFAQQTMSELRKAYDGMKGQIEGLILDLRGNGGGLLTEAIDMAGFFLPKKSLITTTSGRKEQPYNHYSKGKGECTSLPLVILVDENSASASELVSGALQDYDRAVIVGRQTFGKGLVQKQIMLDDGSAIRVTTSHYYTPNGRCIQRPYEKGKSKDYYFDHAERMLSRTYRDSMLAVAPKYKTLRNGRTVAGGGGITPDVYIDFDTTKNYAYSNRVVSSLEFNDFVNEYFLDNRHRLHEQYPTFEEFNQNFTTPDSLLQKLTERMKRAGIELEEESSKRENMETIAVVIKASLARRLWGDTEGFKVSNSHRDEEFAEALSILLDRRRYNQLLGEKE